MCCSVGTLDGDDAGKGLADNHAYTLIGAYQLTAVRLVKIRNPWGTFEWTGKWSDSYSGWTSEMKEQVDFTEANDGTFFMCMEDFYEEFGTTTICRARDNWEYDFIECFRSKGG